ncbi:MAG TPA: hypothetical protein VJR89_37925, partial [Polyangiales bacterium]|nr:hypothetical protein [Polyangiales bacterium]
MTQSNALRNTLIALSMLTAAAAALAAREPSEPIAVEPDQSALEASTIVSGVRAAPVHEYAGVIVPDATLELT